ncbi:MAG: hypothetical protein ACKN9V_06205, partial [Pseudomonadota bacterium]
MRQKHLSLKWLAFKWLGLFVLIGSGGFASPLLDQQYGFKNLVVAVLASPPEPIHATQVENELLSQIQKRMRFTYQAAPSLELKKNLEAISGPNKGGILTERLEIYRPTLQALKEKETDAVVFAELNRRDEFFELTLTLVSVEPGEVLAQAVQQIEPPYSQEKFAQKTALSFGELTRNIPFDGTI